MSGSLTVRLILVLMAGAMVAGCPELGDGAADGGGSDADTDGGFATDEASSKDAIIDGGDLGDSDGFTGTGSDTGTMEYMDHATGMWIIVEHECQGLHGIEYDCLYSTGLTLEFVDGCLFFEGSGCVDGYRYEYLTGPPGGATGYTGTYNVESDRWSITISHYGRFPTSGVTGVVALELMTLERAE